MSDKANFQDIETANLSYDDLNERYVELLDNLWGIVYPGKTDWEYPKQAERHLEDYVNELKKRNELLEARVRLLSQMIIE
jgi:hypothetical protein